MTATAEMTNVAATVDRDILLSLLQSCSRAVAKRTTIPILQYVRVSFEKGRVAMRATDLDTTIDCEAVGMVGADGESWEFICSYERLSKIVRTLGEGEVRFSRGEGPAGEGRLNLTSGLAKLSLPMEYAVADYPSDPDLGDERFRFEIESGALRTMLKNVSFASDDSESAFTFAGVGIARTAEGIDACATDGKRLSVATFGGRFGADIKPFVIHRQAVAAIDSLPSPDDETVAITVHENFAVFSTDQYRLSVRLSDHNVPEYRNAIPTGTVPAIVTRETMLAALRRIATVVGEQSKCVAFDFKPGNLTLSVKSQTGTAEERIPCDYSGEPWRAGFDVRYLLDFMTVADSEMVEIGIVPVEKEYTPMTMCPGDEPEGRSLLYVVVSMRIYWS